MKQSPAIIKVTVTLFLAIATASAAFAAHTIKTIFETQEVAPSDGQSFDRFGAAVAVSGNLAIVGAPDDDDKGTNSGSVYAYAFDGTTWNFQAKLNGAEEAAFDSFGSAVAISGNMALIGAPLDSTLGANSGAVYVFAFDGTAWSEQTKLFFAGEGSDLSNFGESIAFSGNTAVIGAPGFHDPGGAYVFTFDGTSWSQQAKLTGSDTTNLDDFASSISLSGNRVLVGAFDNGFGGAAYIFNFNGTNWSEEAKLTALDTAEDDDFGLSVSLSGDLALIGAPHKSTNRGAAYVFAFDGASWSQQTKLKAPGGMKDDYFGYTVNLSGTVALVGAIKVVDPGVVYEYALRRNSWALGAQLVASNGISGNLFGESLARSGNTVFAGADDGPGEAYTFSLGR
jgi:hypothetical protein